MRKTVVITFVLIAAALVFAFQTYPAFAAQQGDYLNYQEPQNTGYSWLSTISYVFSLLVMFAVVLGLAYFTSRFLGQRMGKSVAPGDSKVVLSLPLGPNRGVSVVEVAGKYLVLGVTDHNINLLQEITDPAQIETLKNVNPYLPANQFETIFQRHVVSLQQISQKFPGVFGGQRQGENEDERGKR